VTRGAERLRSGGGGHCRGVVLMIRGTASGVRPAEAACSRDAARALELLCGAFGAPGVSKEGQAWVRRGGLLYILA
jgi:hypothetical protein